MDVFRKTIKRPRSHFGTRLKAARLAKGLTQVEVSEKIDNSCHKNISRWEAGINTPNLRIFIKLCKIYGVTPNDLLGF